MNDSLLRLYHRMPPVVRSLAASARGFKFRRLRYGPETPALVERALERERWAPEQWQAWRDERLSFLLRRALTKVPYYREQWAERRRRGDNSSWEVLANWPILTKDVLRQNARAFVADDCDPARMTCEHTSGTSGKPLELWLSRDTVRAWYALFEARCRRWYGLSRHDCWGILGGQLVAPVTQSKPPFWVWNAGLHQLYLSVYHLSPEFAPSYLKAIRRHRVRYLVGYPSALDALAEAALRLGGRDPNIHAVITNAEPLLASQRERIEAAFHCPVYETYGMSEIVAAANQCEHGAMHLWPEAGILEVVDGDRPLPQGSTGDLLSTGLMNPDMPLIRYRTGDRCALGPERPNCACGRTLPLLGAIEGRCDDIVYTRDGRRVGRLDPVFKASLPIEEAQIVQESLDRIRIVYVPDATFSAQSAADLIRIVRDRLGDMEVILDRVDRVPRGANGKFRAVVSKLSPAELEYAKSIGTEVHAAR
jgi:phenylacetate-CoA ligase